MQKKEVLLVLTDRWADWEAAYAIAVLNDESTYTIKILAASSEILGNERGIIRNAAELRGIDPERIKAVAVDLLPKVSIGGLHTEIDCRITDYHDFANVALVILPGGYSWSENQYLEIAEFIREAVSHDVPIAAICGATIFLGKHGILDNVRHTGDEFAEYFESLQGYNGHSNFIEAQVVNDNGVITANETAALEFAREIFLTLKIDSEGEIEKWYDKFKNGMVR